MLYLASDPELPLSGHMEGGGGGGGGEGGKKEKEIKDLAVYPGSVDGVLCDRSNSRNGYNAGRIILLNFKL